MAAHSRARFRLERLREPLRQRVCVEWDYCTKKESSDFSDTLTLTTAVADIIVTVLGGIPAGTVAALLVKKGLSRMCACGPEAAGG